MSNTNLEISLLRTAGFRFADQAKNRRIAGRVAMAVLIKPGWHGANRSADSKFQHVFGSGWRIAISSSAVMSCITTCMPVRSD